MATGYTAKFFSSATRVLLISDFTLVSRLIGVIPLIGWLCALAYMSIISSYYCFEWVRQLNSWKALLTFNPFQRWTFSTKNWSLDYRIKYLQARLAYMLGFGRIDAFCPVVQRLTACFFHRISSDPDDIFRTAFGGNGHICSSIPLCRHRPTWWLGRCWPSLLVCHPSVAV